MSSDERQGSDDQGSRRGSPRGLFVCVAAFSAAGASAAAAMAAAVFGRSMARASSAAPRRKSAWRSRLRPDPRPRRAAHSQRTDFPGNGRRRPNPPQYRLDVTISESVISTLVQVDGDAGAQIYNIEASYNLVRLADKKVVAHGKSFGRASFDRVTSIFANVEARQDAENRAAQSVGEELRTRLLAVLSTTA